LPDAISAQVVGLNSNNIPRSLGVSALNAPDFSPGVRTLVPTETLGEPRQPTLPPLPTFDTGAPAQTIYFGRKRDFEAQQRERGGTGRGQGQKSSGGKK